MKKIIKLVTIAIVAAVGLGLCSMQGCKKKKEPKNILPIDNISEQVVSFFGTNLPATATSDCFFKSNEHDICYLINNIEEFKAIYLCDNALPEIDFEKYSLVVGQKKMHNSYYNVVKQNIEETDILTLNIQVKPLAEGQWPAFSKMYYWSIYPKLPNKKIDINIEITK